MIADELGIAHTEIDGLYHGPGWVPRESFGADVERLAAQDSWVTEWQYPLARPLLLERADLMVWLDLPVAAVLRQVTARTIRRRLSRQVLWNGNREAPLLSILTDRDHIIRWSWRTRHSSGHRVSLVSDTHPLLPVVRLVSRSQVLAWIEGPLRGTTRSPT